jgi:hypothetical protein
MTLYGIKPGDRVHVLTPQGGVRAGRAVLCYTGHVVLNAGGPHGTPVVADAVNVLAVNGKPVGGKDGAS